MSQSISPDRFLDHFSTHLKNVIARSISVAGSMGLDGVLPAHLLLALREEQGSVGAEILNRLGASTTHLQALMGERKDPENIQGTIPVLGKHAKAALEKAMLVAYEHEHTHVGTEHLLFGLTTTPGSKDTLDALCLLLNTSTDIIVKELETIFASISKFAESSSESADAHTDCDHDHQAPPLGPLPKKTRNKKKTALDAFAVELTHASNQSTIDPVIGREEEIERLIHVLARRTKNNPVLIGEPGVGKTAIVEGLAKRIHDGDVPDILKRKKILSLDLTAMVAGTMYRGEFEGRLKQVMEEVKKQPDYIVFIDELHTIIGAGSNQGSMDAANILKPALARGQLRCIGATTEDEYKKHITTDPALERRFQPITVEEPSTDEAKEILMGLREYYEAFHQVKITEEAVNAAVELSSRFIQDNFLPDKAIDLIDEAAAALRTKRKATPTEKKLANIEAELEAVLEQKESAIHSESFESAIDLKKKQSELEAVQKEIKASLGAKKQTKRGTVTDADIIAMVSRKTRIPASVLTSSEWERIDQALTDVRATIIGQEKSLTTIEGALKRAHLGLGNRKRPLTSMLFAGPSGVGKTATAKALAESLYHDEKALIRIDMSEFAESHGVSKLLGSPAGYVGFNERNRFTDALKKRPHAIVLFDESDKAHADVQKLLLQILDQGEITDSTGKKVSFRQAIIVLTTNIGAERFHKSAFGFGEAATSTAVQTDRRKTLLADLKQSFGQALTSRIEHVCTFTPLTQDHIAQIAKGHVSALSTALTASRNLTVSASEQALTAIAKRATDPQHGARTVEQVVETVIQDLLIKHFGNKQTDTEQALLLDVKNDTEFHLAI